MLATAATAADVRSTFGASAQDDEPDAPWAGVFEVADEDAYMGACRRVDLGQGALIDIAAEGLNLLDAKPAISNGLILVHTVVSEEAVLEIGGQAQAVLRPGDVYVRTACKAAALKTTAMARIVTLALPRHLVTPRFAPADGLSTAGQVFAGAMPARLVRDFLLGLADDERDAASRVNPVLDAAGALVGLCLAERPAPQVALSALATARAEEILRYLDRNFANAQLTPASMADDLGISVRYAHKLLEQTGRSFRRELISLRLNAARRAFAARGGPRQTIADIAISVGFNDLSQFNRHFRAAFGMTPRAARREDEALAAAPGRANGGASHV